MSLNDVIESMSTGGGNPDGTYTVTRTVEASYSHGRAIAGASSTFPLVAGIEPVDGRTLMDLPEGQRGDEVIRIFTATPLLTRRPGFAPDTIVYRPPGYESDGEPWTVTRVEVLEGFGEVHFEVIACRAPSPAGVVP